MAKTSLIAKRREKPKFKVRGYTRCKRCGRPRAYLRKFHLCRICFPRSGASGTDSRCGQGELVENKVSGLGCPVPVSSRVSTDT